MDDSLRLTHDKEDTVYKNGYFVLYRAANDKPYIATAKFSIFPAKIVAFFIHDILTWVPKTTCILHSSRTTVSPLPSSTPNPHSEELYNATEKVCYIFKPGVLFGFLYRNTGN